MAEPFELEVEMRKVIHADLDELKVKYPREWAEAVEDYGEEDGEREFVIECYGAGPDDFQSTPYDDTEYTITKLAPQPKGAQP